MKSAPRALSVAAALLLAAGSAQPQVLSLLLGEASVQTAGPGLPNSVLRDPWLAEVTASTSYGRADLGSGRFQASAEWLPSYASAVTQISYVAGDINLQNAGAVPLALGPISLLFDAAMTQHFDADDGGLAHFAIGILSASVGGTTQTARADLSYAARRDGGAFWDNLQPFTSGAGGGMAGIVTATPGSFEAGLSLPGFTLAPGQVLRVLFSLQIGASGDGGWGALVDATNSAQLSMQVPLGVSVVSPQPLAWISAVPEPGRAALLLAGLVFVLAGGAGRRLQGARHA